MAITKKFDAAVAVREYKTRTGETKKQWANVGAVLEFDDGGMCLMLEKWFNPAGVASEGGVRISFFEPKARDDQQPAPAPRPAPQAQAAADDFDSDIPF